MTNQAASKIECTCPCIDCIEGNHCGGEYWWPEEAGEDGTEPQLIGVCHHLSDQTAHDMGLVVDGCDCRRCRPDLYEDDDDSEEIEAYTESFTAGDTEDTEDSDD